jgi:hypothetical protein
MAMPEPKVTLRDITQRLFDALADLANCDPEQQAEKTQILFDTIEGIEGEMGDKIERILLFQEHVDENAVVADAHRAFYAEKGKFWSGKRKTYESISEGLKKYVINCLETVGITRQFQAGRFRVTVKDGTDKVFVDDVAKIPMEFFKHDEDNLRLDELKKKLKAGEVIPGVHLGKGKKSLVLS